MVVRGRTRMIGRIGEEHTVKHLVGIGWQMLDRNWRCNEGELDIIAYDPHAGALVFIEVKCRLGLDFGDPLEVITRRRCGKLRRLNLLWLTEHRIRADWPRIDTTGVLLHPGQGSVVSHVRRIEE